MHSLLVILAASGCWPDVPLSCMCRISFCYFNHTATGSLRYLTSWIKVFFLGKVLMVVTDATCACRTSLCALHLPDPQAPAVAASLPESVREPVGAY